MEKITMGAVIAILIAELARFATDLLITRRNYKIMIAESETWKKIAEKRELELKLYEQSQNHLMRFVGEKAVALAITADGIKLLSPEQATAISKIIPEQKPI